MCLCHVGFRANLVFYFYKLKQQARFYRNEIYFFLIFEEFNSSVVVFSVGLSYELFVLPISSYISEKISSYKD